MVLIFEKLTVRNQYSRTLLFVAFAAQIGCYGGVLDPVGLMDETASDSVDLDTADGDNDDTSSETNSDVDTDAGYMFDEPFDLFNTTLWTIAGWEVDGTQLVTDTLQIDDGVLFVEHYKGTDDQFKGGEIDTTNRFSFGTWTVVMASAEPKSSGASGTICHFALVYNGLDGDNKISIEVVGGKLWVGSSKNWQYATDGFENSPTRHHYIWPEDGFPEADTYDPSEFHTYRFQWTPESIVFWVDDQKIYEIAEDPGTTIIPTDPMSIRLIHWSSDHWADSEYPPVDSSIYCKVDSITGVSP